MDFGDILNRTQGERNITLRNYMEVEERNGLGQWQRIKNNLGEEGDMGVGGTNQDSIKEKRIEEIR